MVNAKPIKILFLAANPQKTPYLALHDEADLIKSRLSEATLKLDFKDHGSVAKTEMIG